MVDTKYALRMIWVIEGALLIVMSFVILLFLPKRMDGLIMLIPWLAGIIGFEGAAAAGGSSLKRITEAAKAKAGCKPAVGRK